LSVPASPPTVPAVVARFAAGRPVRAIWVNELGGVTFRVGPGSPGTEFVQVADADEADFAGESERLRWAVRCVTVPYVLGWGRDGGRCCGHVDFGGLGVADRWADLAVATLSLGWNYPGRRWDAEFFDAYGVEPDPRASITTGDCGRPTTRPRAKLGG
jgi:aminoglycoside phosphotransferase